MVTDWYVILDERKLKKELQDLREKKQRKQIVCEQKEVLSQLNDALRRWGLRTETQGLTEPKTQEWCCRLYGVPSG